MTDHKDTMLKGVRMMAISVVFIFGGPALHFWLGADAPLSLKILAFLIMAIGVFYAGWGLKKIIKGLFKD